MRRASIALGVACAALAACGGDDGGSGAENVELFTSEGFEQALDAVEGEVGDDVELLRIQITGAGAQVQTIGDEGTRGFVYADGELRDVEVAGAADSLGGEGFPLSEVDAAAVDRIASGVQDRAPGEIRIEALTLERNALSGELGWTINADSTVEGKSGTVQDQLLLTATPDGTVAEPRF